tara:strand:- start:140 stop:253 length:114 start_codon:yes stop_codon:yes gene_type:complete
MVEVDFLLVVLETVVAEALIDKAVQVTPQVLVVEEKI